MVGVLAIAVPLIVLVAVLDVLIRGVSLGNLFRFQAAVPEIASPAPQEVVVPTPTATGFPTAAPVTPDPTSPPSQTPLPTATPYPTPSPTTTPSPTADIAAIVLAVQPVGSGQGVPAAAPYDAAAAGPHPLVLLMTPGPISADWNAVLPAGWLPSTAEQTELVALIGDEREIDLGSAAYTLGPDITAYRFERDLELREARTGRTVAAWTFQGTDPRPFPHSAPMSQTRIEGSRLTVWDLEDWLCPAVMPQGCWQPLRVLDDAGGIPRSVAISPDGRLVAAGYINNSVRLWQVSDGTLLRAMQGHTETVTSVAFSPDGQTLASGSVDNTVRLWQVADGTSLRTIHVRQGLDIKWYSNVNNLVFSPDGQTLATANDTPGVRLWRVSDGSPLRTLAFPEEGRDFGLGNAKSVAFSPDGEVLASGWDIGVLVLYRTSDGSMLRIQAADEGAQSSVSSLAFSPDGQALAAGSFDGTVRVWRVSDGNLSYALPPATMPVGGFTSGETQPVVFSPDGAMLATAARDYTVRLWRAHDGALIRTLMGHTSPVISLVFATDGRMLASASFDGDIRLWHVSDSAAPSAPPAPTPRVAPAFEPVLTEPPAQGNAAPPEEPTPPAVCDPASFSEACRNESARFSAPCPDASISGIVPIVGTANIPDFSFYKVQFLPESKYADGTWGELYQSDTPVVNGTLMEWHTGTVPPGAYWLRLLVTKRDGNYPPPCELRVVVTR